MFHKVLATTDNPLNPTTTLLGNKKKLNAKAINVAPINNISYSKISIVLKDIVNDDILITINNLINK